jgi:hypothetical protein
MHPRFEKYRHIHAVLIIPFERLPSHRTITRADLALATIATGLALLAADFAATPGLTHAAYSFLFLYIRDRRDYMPRHLE